MKLPEIDKCLRDLATLNTRHFAVSNVLACADPQTLETGPIARLLLELAAEQATVLGFLNEHLALEKARFRRAHTAEQAQDSGRFTY